MEKEGYREMLEMLSEKYPGKIAISVKEVADATDLAENTVRGAMRKACNPLPSVKIGGRRMIPIPQLARWMVGGINKDRRFYL